jgi:hypothetical protein
MAVATGNATDDVWADITLICACGNVAPKIVDLWWAKLSETYEEGKKPLPFLAVRSLMSWASKARDIPRGMKCFSQVKSWPHGIRVDGVTGTAIIDLRNTVNSSVAQQCFLELAVKALAMVRLVVHDGGVREAVIKEIQSHVGRAEMVQSNWYVLNDLIAGLTFASAMATVKLCSTSKERSGGDGSIPFFVWASLLRRAARDHLLAESEHLFGFVRRQFALSADEKQELLDIMMRMFATLPVPDFTSTQQLFLDHVIRTPPNEPQIQPSESHYYWLMRAADSRETANMVFLEGLAGGIKFSHESFRSIFSRNPGASMPSLSSKLPHDYPASELDSLLFIPAEVDAHLRREEAMKFRNKPLVDSTGEVT